MNAPRLPRALRLALSLSLLLLLAAPLRADETFATPLDYGAVGDGTADDTAALRSALAAKTRVDLAGRSYRITGTVTIAAGRALVGPGTIVQDYDANLTRPDGRDVALRVTGNDVLLENFTLRKPFVDGSYSIGIVADHVQRLTVRRLDISGYSARYGIHIIESADFEVSGCHIHDFMMNTTADMIEDSPAGLRVTRSHRGIVSGNRIIDIEVGVTGRASISPIRPQYGKQGYQSDCMTIMQCAGVTLVGNVCVTSGEGIDMLLSNSCVLADNVVRDIWFQGFKMLGVSFCTVSGNFLSDCYQGIGLAYHDGLETGASGNSVTGNTLRDIGSPGSFGIPAAQRVSFGGLRGIDIHDEGCSYNVVVGNTIVDTQATKTTSAGVYNGGGPTNLIENNIFTKNLTATD